MKSRTQHRITRAAGTVTGLAIAVSLAYGAASFADSPPAGNGSPLTPRALPARGRGATVTRASKGKTREGGAIT